jgi:hypothetical protein
MAGYFLACAWGLFILLALTGWGSGLKSVLFSNEQAGWAQRAAWGLALAVGVGGVLNLFYWVSPAVIWVFLGLGVILWGADISRSHLAPRLWRPAVLILIALALIRYAASASGVTTWNGTYVNHFDRVDDYQAYLVFPEKMVQTGAIGRDPFCARRIRSALGGQYFLDSLVTSTVPLQHVRVVDGGLGLLITAGLAWSSAWAVVPVLFILVISPPANNLTSVYTGMAVLLSLVRVLAWPALPTSRFWSRVVIIALIVSAACSLKSSFIPTCGIMLVCSYARYVWVRRFSRESLAEVAAVALLTVLLLVPWMISMHQSSGTYLYPLLGKGYEQSVYGNSASPSAGLTVSGGLKLIMQSLRDPFLLGLALLAVLLVVTRPAMDDRIPVWSLLAGVVIGRVLLLFSTNSILFGTRYAFPLVFAGLIAIAAELQSRRPAAVACALTLCLIVGFEFRSVRELYADCYHAIRLGLTNKSLASADEATRYAKLQQSVPPGQVLLTRMGKPFLLDFKRNNVLLVDMAEASPPPGMPFFRGSAALAQYLRSQSIRYVAYSYVGGGFVHPDASVYAHSPAWIQNSILHQNDFQDNLEELAKTRTHIYDDGNNFVLDLDAQSSANSRR